MAKAARRPVVRVKCARKGCRNFFDQIRPNHRFCSESCQVREWQAENYGQGRIAKLKAEVEKLRIENRLLRAINVGKS